MTKYQDQYPITLMCKALKINRSTYYKQLHWIASNRELETRELDETIQIIFYDNKKRYGAPKIHQLLLAEGWRISLKRVQRRMSALGLRSIVIKEYRHFSDNNPVTERENILKQDFTATGINQKWCTDITYIHTLMDGWIYDNAGIESFHSVLKKEEIHQNTYVDSKDAFNAIFEYIESWYNNKRIQRSINYQTPNAVHQAAHGAA